MALHANAPLGPKGRLTMVRRVIEQGWSLAEAAEHGLELVTKDRAIRDHDKPRSLTVW